MSDSAIARQVFTTQELESFDELNTQRSIAEARAEIEAQVYIAKRYPRTIETFRTKLLEQCRLPEFAAEAWYRRPVGRKLNETTNDWEMQFAEDFSIRAMEQAARLFGNNATWVRINHEDPQKRKIEVKTCDLESNQWFSHEAVVPKQIERHSAEGRVIRGDRRTSSGKTIFIVDASLDELRNMTGVERSKLYRDNIRRMIPKDILVEAARAIAETNANENARDPDAAKKKVTDKFFAIGITADMLMAYLQRSLDTLTSKDLAELAVLYNGLKDGEFVWGDVMKTMDQSPAEGAPTKASKAADKLRAKLQAARDAVKPAESDKTEKAQ